MQKTRLVAFLILVAGVSQIHAQLPNFSPVQGERVDAGTALSRALKTSALTDDGKPFHAVLAIGDPKTPYNGRVEVWWAAKERYKIVLTSPAFKQTRIINGADVMETDNGDYYPRWLETFVDALLDPIPMIGNFRGRGGIVMLSPQITSGCLRRDDRPGGVTDPMTVSVVFWPSLQRGRV